MAGCALDFLLNLILEYDSSMTLVASLRSPPFAFLWTGQTISRFGDHLYRVALAWWVLEKTGSAAAMGTVLIFSSVPMLAFVLIGGIAVDRFPRARVMFLSDLLRAAVVGIITFLGYSNQLEIWHIYVASILFGFVAAFFQPAYTAIVPDIVPSAQRPSANSLTALSVQLTGILGPAVGASVVALSGTASAFALDALSFVISALCLLPLLRIAASQSEVAGQPHARTNPWNDFREGFGAVTTIPWLWITILLAALMNLTEYGPYSVALPFLVRNNLGNDVQILGWLYSAGALGSVLAAIWLGRKSSLKRRGLLAYASLIIWGLTTSALGLPITVPFLLAASFAVGGSINIFSLIWTNTLQEMVPRDLLGRVSSIDYLGSFVLLPIGYGVAGWATDWVGAPAVLFVGGILTALLALAGLTHPSIRQLD